jgi:hypothetical protein
MINVEVFNSTLSFYAVAVQYQKWMDRNGDEIEVISVIASDNVIVLTYREVD